MRRTAAGLVCLTALFLSGCGTVGPVPADADKAGGKALFVEKCGSCHTLAAAGTLGKVGPNLDDSFAAPREQGFAENTVADIVRDQIAMAVLPMPANIVTGADADAVAAYVASVAGLPVGTATGTIPTAPATTEQTTTEQTTTEQTTTTATTTEAGGASAAEGKTLFTSLGCAGCHSIDGAAGVGPTLQGIFGSEVELEHGQKVQGDEAYLLDSIFDPDKQIADGYTAGVMSGSIPAGSISQANARDLVAYIKTLK